MGTVGSFEKGNYIRCCDSCGARFNRKALTKKADGFYYCNRGCDKLVPAVVLDERIAAAPQLKVRPVPDAKPDNVISVATDIEGRMLNVLDEVAPYRYYDVTVSSSGSIVGSQDIQAAAETIRALYNIVVENKRQTVVIARAKAKIATLADWLLARQYGNAAAAAAYAAAATATEYGAFTAATDPTTATVYSADVGAAGLALVYAYNTHGTGAYLDAAKRAAKCLRRMQRGDLRTTNFSATADQGSGRRQLGYWTHSFTVGGCQSSPEALSSESPTDGSTVASFATVSIVFAGAVKLNSFTVLRNGVTATGGWSLSPALGSTATTFTWTCVFIPSGSYSATVIVDQNNPCKTQSVNWTWTKSGGGAS